MDGEKIKKEYSASQKYRFALFDLWSLESQHGFVGAKGVPFEVYYQNHMELLTKAARDRIEKILHPEIV